MKERARARLEHVAGMVFGCTPDQVTDPWFRFWWALVQTMEGP